MQFTLEKGQKSFERKFIISIPATEIDGDWKSKVVEYSKHAALPGFRPGKVTPQVIEKRFGKSLRQETIYKAAEKYYEEALKAEKIRPMSQAAIEIIKDLPGEDVEFSVSFEVVPEIELKGLEGIEVETTEVEITDADVAEVIERIRKQSSHFHASTEAAKNGDRVTIDFEGFIDGEAFQGGSANNFKIVLGAGQMIPGFEDGLLGAKAEEDRELKVTFPAEYHVADLAGKAAVFKTKIHQVETPHLPEMDESFFRQYNVSDLDGLKAEITQNMKRELDAKLKSQVKETVLAAVEKANDIELSPSLVQQEAQMMGYQMAKKAGLVDPKTGKLKMDIPVELFKEAAEKRVRLSLLMIRLIEKFEVKASKEQVDEALESFVQVFEDKDQVKKEYLADPERMMGFHQQVLEDQVIEKLLEGAKITKKKKAFFDVIDRSDMVQG